MTLSGLPFILASKSAARIAMLRAAGLDIDILPAAIDERALERGWEADDLAPEAVALGLAREKALAVSRGQPGRIVIGADQTMALGRERFSKVATMAQARGKLLRLRGRRHALHSAFAVARDGGVLASGVASAHLAMRDFSDAFLDAYLERAGEAILSSVGCYHLEGLGVTLFDAIDGDYFTILGLPLLALLADLRRNGLVEG
ncbi:Maf family protein [Labrys monachus]|uniref:Nucleoside triphosphate pyrophosphatase n=1 Tax=Labrys monachus TaxID=217067 RepID=A0ABU0FN59_9HYPH|nr:Maf family protein [Labrys monachus]MDQ0396054.1 septum formation protein [Labrys monachus]